MAYSETVITSSVTQWYNTKQTLARESDGTLWCLYWGGNGRYLYTKTSGDNGATWGTAVQVADYGSTGGTGGASIKMGLDDNPLVFGYRYNGNNTNANCFRWNGSSWTLQGSVVGSSTWTSSEPNPYFAGAACVASTGRWYQAIGWGLTTSATMGIYYSDNDGVTWTAITTPAAGGTTTAAFRVTRNNQCVDLRCDESDNLHILFADFDSSTNKHAMYYYTADASSDPGSLTWSTQKRWDTPAGAGANDLPFVAGLAVDSSGDIHACWEFYTTAADGTTIESFYAKKTSGTWGSTVTIDSGDFNRCYAFGLVNDVPFYIGNADPGNGHTGTSNLVRYLATDGTGATWNGVVLDADDVAAVGLAAQYTAGLAHTRLTAGYAAVWWNGTSSDISFIQDGPTWAVESSLTQSIETDIALSQDMELPDSPTTVTPYWEPILQGDRYLTRNSSGTEWMAVKSAAGGGLYAFSRVDGASKSSWAFTTVSTDSFDSVAMDIDGNGFPFFIAHKAGASNVKVFAWNGVAYVQNASISTGHSTIGSMTCWYDGTLYHIAYPHKKSNGKWRLLHRTSTDVTDSTNRFGSSTEVWLTDNSTNSDSLRDGRRISGMRDSNDDFHLIVASKDGTTYQAKYFVYDESAGTWSSATTLLSSSTAFMDGLSLAVDVDDYVHVAMRSSGILLYQTNTSGSFVQSLPGLVSGRSSELVSYPSVGMRRSGTQPSIIIQQEDEIVGEWHNDGTGWSWLGIFTNSVAYGSVAPGASYNRRSNFQRTTFGIAFGITGSLIYVGSSYIQWDSDSEPSETEVAFSQEVAIKGLVYPETDAEFSQTQTYVRETKDSSSGAASFSGAVNDPARDLPRANIADDADVAMGHNIAVSINGLHYRNPQHNLDFGQVVGVTKRQNLGDTTDLSFSHSISLTLGKTITGDVEFDHEIDLIKQLTKSIASALGLSQTILKTGEWQRGVTHSVTFGAEGLAVRDWNAYDPAITISDWPTYEDSVMQVVFQWPAALPTESVTFMRPNFGDQRIDSRRGGAVRRNRSGRARTYAVPVYSSFVLQWKGIPRHVGENWRQKMIKWLGSAIRYQDHNGIWHECMVTDTELTRTQGGPEHNTFSITLQKTSRVDLSPSTAG